MSKFKFLSLSATVIVVMLVSGQIGQVSVHAVRQAPTLQVISTISPVLNGTQTSEQGGGDIAFRNENGQLSVMNVDGSNVQVLTPNESSIGGLTWSPDGQSIAYLRYTSKFAGDICKFDFARRVSTCLTGPKAANVSAQVNNSNPAWSPSGKTIAFGSYQDSSHTRVYLMDTDGANVRPLTDGPSDNLPTWSADGNQIAFLTASDKGALGIAVINADATGKHILADLSRLTFVRSLAWSPDGKTLALTGLEINADRIYLLNIQTGKYQLAAFAAAFQTSAFPSWSPDSKQIVFEGDFSIYIANADAAKGQLLGQGGFPTWKPLVTSVATLHTLAPTTAQ